MNELKIRQERIEKGWTQKYVGSTVGVSKQSIYDIETGKQKPSYDVLLKLLTLFEVKHCDDISKLFAPVEDFQTTKAVQTDDPAQELK